MLVIVGENLTLIQQLICVLKAIILINCIKNWVRIIITVLGVNGSLPLWFLNNLRIPEKRA